MALKWASLLNGTGQGWPAKWGHFMAQYSKRILTLGLAGCLAMGLAGCAETSSIHRVTGIKATTPREYGTNGGKDRPEKRASAQIVTVDAKQRHLLVSPEIGGYSDVGWRMCAEAAPDVFSAYASAIGGEVSGDSSGGKGVFSSSMAETAATIERTQTINLLRESMYRTCERYLSGAISKEIFVIQAARDQKSMVSVLAIEQLTGAIRPRSTVISGPSTMASVFSGEEAAKLVKQAMSRVDEAKAIRDAKQLAFDQGKADGICDDVKEGDSDAAQSKADPAKCQALTSELDAAKEAYKKAEEGLADATKLAASLATGSTATTTGLTPQTGGIDGAQHDAETIKAVASAIVEIVKAPPINETLMWCISMFSDKRLIESNQAGGLEASYARGIDPDIKSLCINVMKEAATSDRNAIETQSRNPAMVPRLRTNP